MPYQVVCLEIESENSSYDPIPAISAEPAQYLYRGQLSGEGDGPCGRGQGNGRSLTWQRSHELFRLPVQAQALR
jgi:hypothetical protein